MAALFLRRIITIYWGELDVQTQELSMFCYQFSHLVKSKLLESLRKEPFSLARKALCGVVSKLGSMELKNNRWVEILSYINEVRFQGK